MSRWKYFHHRSLASQSIHGIINAWALLKLLGWFLLNLSKSDGAVAYLCNAAEAGVAFGGSDLQGVQVVTALVVNRSGEAQSAAFLVDAEQVSGVNQ